MYEGGHQVRRHSKFFLSINLIINNFLQIRENILSRNVTKFWPFNAQIYAAFSRKTKM